MSDFSRTAGYVVDYDQNQKNTTTTSQNKTRNRVRVASSVGINMVKPPKGTP